MIFLRFRDILLLILYPKIAYKGISANTRGHCVIMVLSGWIAGGDKEKARGSFIKTHRPKGSRWITVARSGFNGPD